MNTILILFNRRRNISTPTIRTKIEVLSEDEQLIEDNRKSANESAQNWASNIVNKKVEIKADDGIALRGTEYITDENTENWAIVLHGYRAEPKSVLTIGEHFSEKGYNVLIPSMRACSDSDGEFVGMGWLDKDDLKCWINLVLAENSNAKIILHASFFESLGISLDRFKKCFSFMIVTY